MRILLLTQIIPYPPDAGPKVKTWHVLRYLAESGHQITLVSFVRSEEEQYLPVMKQLCTAVHPVPIRTIFTCHEAALYGRSPCAHPYNIYLS